MTIPNNHSFDHNVTDFVLENDFKRRLNVEGVAGRYNLNNYATAIGGDALNANIGITNRNGDLRVNPSGDLANTFRATENSERMVKSAEEALARTPDSKSAQTSLNNAKKTAEKAGASAQKQIAASEKLIEQHRTAFSRQHAEHLNTMFNTKRQLQDAVGAMTLDRGGAIQVPRSFARDIGNREIHVRVDGRDYSIDRHGIYNSNTGNPVGSTTEARLSAIRSAANEQLDRHYTAAEAGHQEAYRVAQEHYDAKLEHLKDMKTKVSERTGAGEYVKGKSSVNTPGGAVANAKGVMTEAHYNNNLNSVERAMADVKAKWKSGIGGKFETTVGVIGIADGARRAWEGAKGMMSNDPEKQDQAGMGTLVTGLAEVTLATLLARRNGANLATGRG